MATSRGKQGPPPTDADTAKDLILWARKERINISHITVGSISLVMVDNHALRELAQPTDPAPDVRQGIYAQYGGGLLGGGDAAPAVGTVEPTIEDDDD
jgi:hypothetical protein